MTAPLALVQTSSLASSRAVGRIRSRRTFAALGRSPARARSGPLTVSYVERREWPTPEVAYAVGRRVGNAVVRNRLKRRLRAIMSESAPSLPKGAYLVSTGAGGSLLTFDDLKVAMSRALGKATRQRPTGPATNGGDGNGGDGNGGDRNGGDR